MTIFVPNLYVFFCKHEFVERSGKSCFLNQVLQERFRYIAFWRIAICRMCSLNCVDRKCLLSSMSWNVYRGLLDWALPLPVVA